MNSEPLWTLMNVLYKSHPWHGIPVGEKSPEIVNTYIEVVPSDTVKYEIDKITGHLKIDRPQKFSNICPCLYGFIPQTLCAEEIAQHCMTKTDYKKIIGDGDPLDICVLTERDVSHGDILVKARPIGGLRMIDDNEADDKIIAVLDQDPIYDTYEDISDCPNKVIDRLIHYFKTYKAAPGEDHVPCEITDIYGRDEAMEIIEKSKNDYSKRFSDIQGMLTAALRG